jgi:hypothetical protein
VNGTAAIRTAGGLTLFCLCAYVQRPKGAETDVLISCTEEESDLQAQLAVLAYCSEQCR